ncbi:E3 ubiquitin-protein ligase UBR2-like [Anneissia japonica]|uniref:E3 ubiquitin-protein ligase UBR2-like n=1 Tax=Anneissia japonica TaxID=1529436 RepID=UPI0014257286|nr:E3 ubiquitin-protein ligase UBR2-like [Anneissia japonica]
MESTDCASLANQWQRITSEALFHDTLLNYWRVKVPEIFKSGELDNKQENENLKKNLLQPLEWFICNGEPSQMFQQLKQKSNPPQMCGKVFKSGESIYSCRECAMDPTCCLCVTCFQNSRHKNHRYRMTSSNGGGYCDCGDAEAWKKDVACDLHKLHSSLPNQDPLERLPLDMQQYTRALFSIIFRYCYNVLTMEVEGSIPEQWKHEKLEENFCTMLFNDEVHTYEQVIDTLKKAVSCSEKEAIGYATKVDREGRSQVRLGNQDKCQKAKLIIIKNTAKTGSKPLKVSVMHYALVAHQTFALRLLEWLAEIIAISDGLRVILCQVALEPIDDDQSVTEKLILVDTKLWKGARIGWHQLFMGSLLMDLEYKKRLAALFTKHYREAQFDFIKDDHDHNVSIVSLSVQMYTVPSVARYLVAEHHLIKKIVDTFFDYCSQKHVKDGKLNFERGSNAGLRRLLYSITDLKYVLTCKPEEWSEPMKNGVIEGLESMLKLMQLIQGMNSVSRQTDHHIEIEPEWETAFHIQTRLEPCITLLLDWIGSDQSLLIRAFRIVMLKLRYVITTRKEVKMENKQVSGHNVLCIEYDISTQPVSIHIPITRFLAGLYIHLGKYNLNYYKEGLLPMGSLNPMELMEGPLRIQVLKAQCQVGLWRRNGYALLNQLYNYNSVRFQNETYDKDIIMLQTCAAVLPPDHFLIAVLNRFDLIQCMDTQYDTCALSADDVQARQRNVTLLKEFLELLIIILCERYVVGVGEISDTDRIKREVIHQLCISPMTHSEINKSLPEDAQEETGAEDVVNLVGVFKKSGTTGKGIYELNENCLTSYNQYFYHYTRADKSRSEEHQRKARKNHKSIEVAAMVPPLPPTLCHNYSNMCRILECDIFVHILNTTIARTATSKFWSENSTHKALYLTGLALLEEERLHRESKSFQFSAKASEGNPSLEQNLQSLVGNQRIDVYKDLLEWVLKKFSEVSKLKGNLGTELPLEPKSMDDSKEEEEKKTKAELAQERRKRIMAQMSDMQRSFIKKNPSLFEDTNPLDSRKSSTTSMDVDVSDGPLSYAIALGSEQTLIPVREPSKVTCMLCQEEEKISDDAPIMVLTACIQRSSVLSSTRGKKIADKDSFDPLLKSADRYWGTHVSSCGHVMHARCWQIYTDSLVAKENKRPVRFRNHLSFDLSKNEFLCPLCETVGNTVITLLPDLLPVEKSKKQCDVSVEHMLSLIRDVLREDMELKEEAEITMDTATLSDETPAKQKKDDYKKPFVGKSNIGKSTISSEVWRLLSFNQQTNAKYSLKPHLPVDRTEMLKTFSMSIYTVGLNVMPDDSNSRIPIMCWEAVAYTIQTAELYLRVEEKPLFCSLSSRQADCVNALVRLGAEGITVYNHQHVRKQLLRLLNVLIPISVETSGCSILDVDMFTLLVSVCFSMPVLKEAGGKDELWSANLCADPITNKHIMTLALLAHVTQILLTCDLPEDAGSPVTEDMDDMYCREANCLQKVLRDLYIMAGVKRNVPSAFDLWSHVTTSCLQFLRCSALFFNSLAGVPFPAELRNIVFDEFGVLCRYLAVPANLASLFDSQLIPGVHTFLQIWCSHLVTQERLNHMETLLVRYPVQHNKLISLPYDYSDLMNQVASFVCPKSSGIQGESRAPAMCLVCGQVVCSQSYCCQTEVEEDTIGACMAHALQCSSGVGMYLRVRECQLLLVSSKTRGCFHSPPYLDDYGESDVGLRRGNPLRLCKDLYHKLYILWLQHGIPAEVAHKLEANSNLLHIDWQNL